MSSHINVEKAVGALSSKELIQCPSKEEYPYLRYLNPKQRLAASRMEGNYLVIAGPGTGKTHTLAYRVVHLVKSGVDPKVIVVITFTRKAGNELKHRISLLLPEASLGFIGTFHAFSNHISMRAGGASPISKFRLLDQEDDIQVHKLVMAEFGEFNKKVRASQLQKVISYCNNTKLSVEDYVKTYDVRRFKDDIENLVAYKTKYEQYKTEHMLANYDDIILLMSKYLEKTGEKKTAIPYEYLMIDEYQDTNQMQLEFIHELDIKNIMAIGDDFQGIYAFRGADHRIILNFYNDFEDAQMIKLTENYRSTSPIIEYINQTVMRSNLGYQKELKLTRDHEGNAQVISGQSLSEHKAFILDNIKANRKKTHALIYRYNKNRTVFEKALIEEKIEYSVYGGIRLLERRHIKDILAFLMVYLNRRDVVSFNRILTMVPGVGPKTASRLIKSEMKDFRGLSGGKLDLLWQIRDILEKPEAKEKLFDKAVRFYFTIYEHVSSEFYTKDEIKEDFKMVKELLETYESLHNFIINLILDPVIDMHQGEHPKVILTTIHSAKGLEFDYVYYFHTHEWFRNYDVEKMEEDRRLFYVGISRAKDQLYVFDHTDFERSFEEVLRDFENTDAEEIKRLNEAKMAKQKAELLERAKPIEEKPVVSRDKMMGKFSALRKK